MYDTDKQPCPRCGKNTMPKVWLGLNPPICSNCGYQGKNQKIECKITY